MSGIVYKSLVLCLSVGLSLSVATWFKARQELQTVTVANEFLRKTLGNMTVTIAEKDREIYRLGQFDCDTGKRHEWIGAERKVPPLNCIGVTSKC